MNERIKELGIQAGGIWIEHATAFLSGTLNLERFAELVRQDERECDVHECRRKVREADDDSSLAGAIIYRR